MVAIVTIYDEGLIRAFQDDGVPFTSKVAREVMAEAIAICPKGSGTLEAAHHVVQGRTKGKFNAEFVVENTARHALWVHEGTGIYGPRHTPIVGVNQKYLNVPPGQGWLWTISTRLATPGRKRRKGVRGPYIRIYDPDDPYYHSESVDGQRGEPWLRWAGETVAFRHGAF